MAAEIAVTPEAQADILDIYGVYFRVSEERAEDFLSRVQVCLDSIAATPKMHPLFWNQFRRAMLRQYPYAVYYLVEGDLVSVHCIAHTSRDPSYWQQRLP